MTATVRTAPTSIRNAADADLRARIGRRPVGQLWERVGEGKPKRRHYPSEAGLVTGYALTELRGPLAIYSGTATPKCSGIIRAGERVK